MHDCAKAKAARAARNRRHYLRRKEHRRCINVEIGEAAIGFLERSRWLESGAHDTSKIAAAIKDLLELSAKI
jgi:hypothetical protein